MRHRAIHCFKLMLILALSCLLVSACKPQSQAQKATKIAKKRYKHIKHDCKCHAYEYRYEEDDREI